MVECNLQKQRSPQLITLRRPRFLWEKGPGVPPQGHSKELGGLCG
jgi:hypothetical protein